MLTNITSKPVDTDMTTIQNSKASSVHRLKSSKAISPERINEVAQDFEAEFISQMLGSMFTTLDSKDSLGGSDEEGQYQSLLMNEYGKLIARTGGIGVADQVKREMLRMQEVES